MEGEFKLQGNKPVSGEARQANLAALRAELEAWLARAEEADELLARARERAQAILAYDPRPC